MRDCRCAGVLLVLLVVLLSGCGGGHHMVANPLPAPYVPIPIVAGAPVSQALTGVAGQTIATGVDGMALVLPDGAAGELTLAPIVSGPAYPFSDGHGIEIRRPTGSRVQVQFIVPDGAEAQCFVFGTLAGCIDDSNVPRTARWVPITDGTQVGNVYTFDMPNDPQTRLNDGTIDIFLGVPKAPDPLKNIAMQIRATIAAEIAALPDAQRAQANAAYAGEMKPSIGESSDSEGSYYTGFGWYFPNRVVPYFGMRLSSTNDVIAHEIGHYFTHLLAGSEKFRTIIDLAPDENHGLGKQYGGRTTITEEYAYYFQFLRLGHVNNGDPSIGGWLGGIVRQQPSAIDYPSIEGFGCSLMAAMTRTTSGQFPDFNSYVTRLKNSMPAGAMTKSEVLAAYADGASKIDALATALETRMKAKGQGAAFQVLAERLGWSYHATGHILSNKLAMEGVRVTPILKVTQNGTNTTYTASSALTDASGIYHLPRAFFGNAWLRIEYNGLRYEVPYTIDRTQSTVVTQTIPDIDVNFDVRPYISSVTPDMALADQVVTISGGNFGATQPAGTKLLLLVPGVGYSSIEPEIVSWSDDTITIRAPRAVDSPVQVTITNMLSDKNNLWLYLGDGSTWLNKMKLYKDIRVAYMHNPINPFDSINGYSDAIGLSMPYLATAYPDCPVIRSLTWNGATFTGTWRINNYVIPGEIAPVSELITITGTLDPVRRRLINITADMHQESFIYLNHDGGAPNTMTVQLKLKELSGSINEGQHYAAFGIYQSMQSGYPPTPVSVGNVVSYHYIQTGDNSVEYFTNDYNLGNIWESRDQMYVIFDN